MFKEVSHLEIEMNKEGFYAVRVNSNIANEWLKLNIRNRRIRKSLVEYLKKQIASGEWQNNHPQPIVFSKSGRLIDGQHRLSAIAQSELCKEMFVKVRVETGADDGIREYLDTGISRTLDDRVELDSNLVFNKFISQIVTVDFMLNKRTSAQFSKIGKPTPDDAKEFYSLHKTAIKDVFERHRRDAAVGQIVIAYAAMQYFEINGEKADEFYSDLFVSAGFIQQAQMLRDYLIRAPYAKSSGGWASRKEVLGKSIGCMKAHLEGRLVKKVIRCDSF